MARRAAAEATEKRLAALRERAAEARRERDHWRRRCELAALRARLGEAA